MLSGFGIQFVASTLEWASFTLLRYNIPATPQFDVFFATEYWLGKSASLLMAISMLAPLLPSAQTEARLCAYGASKAV
jgi:hypothetical protein